MIKTFTLLLSFLIFANEAVSQEIRSSYVNSKCNCGATSIDSVLAVIKVSRGHWTDSVAIQNNQVYPLDRISFLNNDFATKSFSDACEVKCADFTIVDGFHFGVVDIGINEKDKKQCIKAIKESRRGNFKVKVLTKFKVIEKANELIIIYSETPFDKTMRKWFAK